MKYFKNSKIGVVSRHGKEKVLSPILNQLGFEVDVLAHIDTDSLGTFSGEVERELPALENAQAKCRLAKEEYPFVLASEGSFGPHPWIDGLMLNEEYLVIWERQADHFYAVKKVFPKTNFRSEYLKNGGELENFLEKVDFPSHAIIVGEADEMIKAIQDREVAIGHFKELLKDKNKDSVLVQTDMRAHLNPTRMENIKSLMIDFQERLNHCCPKCSSPQMQLSKTIQGLKCKSCLMPTESPAAIVWSCWSCEHQLEIETQGFEDPGNCPWCNP